MDRPLLAQTVELRIRVGDEPMAVDRLRGGLLRLRTSSFVSSHETTDSKYYTRGESMVPTDIYIPQTETWTSISFRTMNTVDTSSADFCACPYPHLARAREDAAVHLLVGDNGPDVWWITRYEDAREALADPRFSTATESLHVALRRAGHGERIEPADPVVGTPDHDLLATDPPEHTHLRGVVRKLFTPPAVERLRPLVQSVTDAAIDEIAPRGEADLVAELALPMPLVAICELLGVPVDEIRPLNTLAVSHENGIRRRRYELATRRYLHDLIARRRPSVRLDLPDEEQPDVLSALIAACDRDRRLTELDVLDTLAVALLAGQGAAGALIAHGLVALLEHPDQLALLRERPDLLRPAVEELLRYDGAPELARSRITTEDVEIGGATIPAWSLVAVLIGAANRDPRRFEDPDRLDLERGDNRHLAFGRGHHFCLGAPLARLEAQIAIGTLVRRLPDLELACAPDELPWRRMPGGIGRELAALPVRFTPVGA
jgi:cytochrome P450